MNIVWASSEAVPFAKTGGLADVSSSLPSALADAGHTVSVISLMGPPEHSPIPEKLRAAGADITYLNMGKSNPLAGLIQLRRIIRNLQPDIVHSHLIHPNILCRIAMMGLPVPLVNTIHISERRKGKKLFFLLDHLPYLKEVQGVVRMNQY